MHLLALDGFINLAPFMIVRMIPSKRAVSMTYVLIAKDRIYLSLQSFVSFVAFIPGIAASN